MKTQAKRFMLVGLNIIGLIIALTVNALANLLPLNGKQTGALSDQYPNLFVPAGITFAIWGVIYILLVAFVAYQVSVLVKKKDEAETSIEKTGIIFFVSCLANAGWIFAWHYEMVPLSLIVMVVLLVSLIVLYLRLGVGKSRAGAAERYTVHLAASVYLGWISIATIANVTALLVFLEWDGFGIQAQVWTIAVIVVGIALAVTMLLARRDVFYPLVVDWALLGILLKRASENPSSVPGVIATVIAGMAIVTVSVAVQVARRKAY
jgi:hypothetical protein